MPPAAYQPKSFAKLLGYMIITTNDELHTINLALEEILNDNSLDTDAKQTQIKGALSGFVTRAHGMLVQQAASELGSGYDRVASKVTPSMPNDSELQEWAENGEAILVFLREVKGAKDVLNGNFYNYRKRKEQTDLGNKT